jgi:hypothetical protein
MNQEVIINTVDFKTFNAFISHKKGEAGPLLSTLFGYFR